MRHNSARLLVLVGERTVPFRGDPAADLGVRITPQKGKRLMLENLGEEPIPVGRHSLRPGSSKTITRGVTLTIGGRSIRVL